MLLTLILGKLVEDLEIIGSYCKTLFFYNAEYIPYGPGANDYDYTNSIPLPDFNDPTWPLPDMATTEAFCVEMREDFLRACKPSTSSKVTRISWFMPINVMVDLFAVANNIHRMPTLFVFKYIQRSSLLHSWTMDGTNQ